MAHSLLDEIPEPRPPLERIAGGWREVREILAPYLVLALFGAAFWLWTTIAGAAQAVPA